MELKSKDESFTDKFSNFIIKQLKVNKIMLLAIFTACIVIICVGLFLYKKTVTTTVSASEKLTKAYAILAQGNQKEGVYILNEIISKFPDTSAAYQARISKADILIDLQKYEEALEVLSGVPGDGPAKALKPLADARVIYIYDFKKDYPNVILASNKFIHKYPRYFLTKDIYLNLAETYLASGLKDDAVRIFNDILVKFPATLEAEHAQDELNRIK